MKYTYLTSMYQFLMGVLVLFSPVLDVTGQQSGVDLKQKVIGCYSAGDRGSTVMRITKRFIQTENGKQRLPYKMVEIKPESNTILFELLAKDRSNFLQKYVAIIYNSDNEVIERDYDSMDDYRNDHPSGQLMFARDKCSVIISFLK